MKIVFLGTSLLVGSFISPLQAEESKNYVSIGGGIVHPKDTEGDSTLGGTAIISNLRLTTQVYFQLELEENLMTIDLNLTIRKQQ